MVAFTGSTFAKVAQAIKAGTYTATETGTGADTAGFGTCVVIVNAGTFTSTASMTFKVQSATTVGGSYSDISGAVFTAVTTSNDEACYIGSVKLDGTHSQFLRVVGTYSGSGNAVASVEFLFLLPEDSVLASGSAVFTV